MNPCLKCGRAQFVVEEQGRPWCIGCVDWADVAPHDGPTVIDALGRELPVHARNYCGRCRHIFDHSSEVVCPVCDLVAWKRFVPETALALVFLGGAGLAHLRSWSSILFWIALVIGVLNALAVLPSWHRALLALGCNVLRLLGGAMFFGGLAWLVGWLFFDGPGTRLGGSKEITIQ